MSSSSRLAFSKAYGILYSKFHSTGVPSITNRYLSTYYDSQSGLHLPVHDEKEIRLFLNVTNGHKEDNDESPVTPFVPHQLNKDRVEADEVSDKLQRFVQQGIRGVILPPIKFPRDIRNLHTLSAIAPPDFFFLCNSSGPAGDGEKNANSKSNNVDDGILKTKDYSSSTTSATNFSKVLQYENDDEFQDSLQRSVEKSLHITLSITENIYTGDDDDIEPITLANNIASMIDARGGCDFVWISSSSKNKADTMVQVCEELVYLDVAGATIKSRLLVDSLNEDMLEDLMFAGVNKYVIDNENQVEMIENVAKEQGKSLLRLP